jgi:succinoglycan biosynthesis protein ExoM
MIEQATAGRVPRTAPHITVCICTYKRRDFLQRLLEKLNEQRTDNNFTFSAVVADNDSSCSAKDIVHLIAAKSSFPIVYCNEPRQNIALVRNKALENAKGHFIAFIDDDEFPIERWLALLLAACDRYSAAGVLGPVRPHFDQPPPRWLIKGRFCERPEHPTGTVMEWSKCRTGNVLFRRSLLDGEKEPFKEEFGTGGEDQDFFRRMETMGHTFVWCNEAIAYETVPPNRWTRSFMFKRALLRGRNALRHPTGRLRLIVQSLVAVPVYSIMLPITLLVGQHVFVKVAVKFLDHFGRLLALLHLNPVRERQM